MKSKLLLGMLLASNSVFAGKIVQNIEWNQLTLNETGHAVAQSSRNLVSLGFTKSTDDEDGGEKLENTLTSLQFSISNEMINVEGFGALYKYEYDDNGSVEDEDMKLLYVNAGKKFGNLSVGANTYHFNSDYANS